MIALNNANIKNLFLYILYDLDLPPPSMLQLALSGNSKESQSSKLGIYLLESRLINGYPLWIQKAGSNAIWFNKPSSGWIVGSESEVGNDFGGIKGPSGIDDYPTQIQDGFTYYHDGEWHSAAISTDIVFKNISN